MADVAAAAVVDDDDDAVEEQVLAVVAVLQEEGGKGPASIRANRTDEFSKAAELASGTLAEECPVSDLSSSPALLMLQLLLGARLRTGVKWVSCCRRSVPATASEMETAGWRFSTQEKCETSPQRHRR